MVITIYVNSKKSHDQINIIFEFSSKNGSEWYTISRKYGNWKVCGKVCPSATSTAASQQVHNKQIQQCHRAHDSLASLVAITLPVYVPNPSPLAQPSLWEPLEAFSLKWPWWGG
jgi:hypothetical protein